MRKSNLTFVFLIFIVLSILILLFSKTGIVAGTGSLLETIVSPVQSLFFSISHGGSEDKLVSENKALVKKLADYQKIVAENSALRDQFETQYPKSQDLLPASVVSAPSFIPGVSSPEYLVINKGKKDGVKIGMAIVSKDNLVGKIESVSDNLSRVILVTNPQVNFSARTMSVKGDEKVGALGVIRGIGGENMILDNVLLSDKLSIGDYVATKGDLNLENIGFPPSLIIGKITSIDKKASELFQKAKVKSLVNFSKLTTVFVVIKSP